MSATSLRKGSRSAIGTLLVAPLAGAARVGLLASAAGIAAATVSCAAPHTTSSEKPAGIAQSALDPTDLFPTTTFQVQLLVTPPPGSTWTQNLKYYSGPGPSDYTPYTFNYNYTPPLIWPYTFYDGMTSVVWNVTGAFGVQVDGREWDTTACLLGDISRISSTATTSPCAATLPGPGGQGANSIAFGTAGQPLSRTFTVARADDTIGFGAALDNIGTTDEQQASAAILAAFGDGTSAFGNFVQGVGSLLSLTSNSEGAGVVGAIGSFLGMAGALLSVDSDVNQSAEAAAQSLCLGGILGNPPAGSTTPQDTIFAGPCPQASFPNGCPAPSQPESALTAKQLYDWTANGPVTLTMSAKLDFASSNPPFWFNACRAATQVSFVVDRVTNTSTTPSTWSDGLAFQSRSADNAVIRDVGSIESFRANPIYNVIEHDSWPDGNILSCNGPAACTPGSPTVEWVAGGNNLYYASANDPQGLNPPHANSSSSMPISALSPDPFDVAIFFVDATGTLYVSQESVDSLGYGAWRTWYVQGGLPAYAPLAVLRGSRAADKYNVLWVGNDWLVHSVVISTVGGPGAPPTGPSTIAGPTAMPGAKIAAVARMPLIADVFVVGQDPSSGAAAVWDVTGDPSSTTGWSATEIGPTVGQVAWASGVTGSAPSVNDLDVFYVNGAGALQRAFFAGQVNGAGGLEWQLDSTFGGQVSSSDYSLSSVARGPTNIDVLYRCQSGGLCIASATSASTFANSVPPAAVPPQAVGPQPWLQSAPVSIVAQNAFSLDIVASNPGPLRFGGGLPATDAAWQQGVTQGWGVAPAMAPKRVRSDYDGDGVADFAVWRPSDQNFYTLLSSQGQGYRTLFGAPGATPVPADYDGDGITDFSYYVQNDPNYNFSPGWYVLYSSWGPASFSEGANGDIPVPADYDGDGVADIAYWSPFNGTWSVSYSAGWFGSTQWGQMNDVPVPADYDGDGRTDFAVWRPSEGNWYVLYSSTGTYGVTQWGLPGDVPAPADYDGDGLADMVVWRPSEGNWYFDYTCCGPGSIPSQPGLWWSPTQFGLQGDIVAPADYDGDGRADLAVWRPSEGNWYVYYSTIGPRPPINWGLPGDLVPVNVNADQGCVSAPEGACAPHCSNLGYTSGYCPYSDANAASEWFSCTCTE
jgi:hypothetical protein